MYRSYLFIFFTLILTASCAKREKAVTTPWGEVIGDEDSVSTSSEFSFADIVSNGEMIMLTLSGPETYFEYHGRAMGTQYLLCEKFAQRIGVGLRVEVCKDTADMVKRLRNGDADVIAFQLPRATKGLAMCGAIDKERNTSWAVREDNSELADSLNGWYTPDVLKAVKKEETYAYSASSVHRRVYAPMLNAQKGQISKYDNLFKMYAPVARWDWRLMAAQCYQESTFDPRAYSWAGAKGLMQIMPSTAASLGLKEADVYDPAANVEAAARYIAKLNGMFSDVRNQNERINFVLASYNGGHFHVRDAMALARSNGRNPYRWADVEEYVLKLSQPRYYNSQVVKYGYMRGSETADYVAKIRNRWDKYRHSVGGGLPSGGLGGQFNDYVPKQANKKNKFKI